MSIPYENSEAPEQASGTVAKPHPMWCQPVTITWLGRNQFDVAFGDKEAEQLTTDEALSLVIALMFDRTAAPMPMGWLKTPAERAAAEEASLKRREKRAAEKAACLHLEVSTADAEGISLGVSDVLCWVDGFNAARQDGSGPSGLDRLRQIKRFIDRALTAKHQEKAS